MAMLKGIRRVEYTSKATGREVKGYTLYFTEEREEVTGEAAFEEFMNEAEIEPLLSQFHRLDDMIGLEVDVRYNKRGRVQSMQLM